MAAYRSALISVLRLSISESGCAWTISTGSLFSNRDLPSIDWILSRSSLIILGSSSREEIISWYKSQFISWYKSQLIQPSIIAGNENCFLLPVSSHLNQKPPPLLHKACRNETRSCWSSASKQVPFSFSIILGMDMASDCNWTNMAYGCTLMGSITRRILLQAGVFYSFKYRTTIPSVMRHCLQPWTRACGLPLVW